MYFVIQTQNKFRFPFVVQDPRQYFRSKSVDCHKLFFRMYYFSSYRWKATAWWNIKMGNIFEKKKEELKVKKTRMKIFNFDLK